jgi:beta-galactosidase/beta-glucuronidase
VQIKVETPLWFRACDELGLLVIQDMPSLRTSINIPNTCDNTPVLNASATVEFGRQLEILIKQHRSYPCIGSWV